MQAPTARTLQSAMGTAGSVVATGVTNAVERNKQAPDTISRSGRPWPPSSSPESAPYLSAGFAIDVTPGGSYSEEWAWPSGTGGHADGLWRCTVSVRLIATFTGLTADGTVLDYVTSISSNPDVHHDSGHSTIPLLVVCNDTTKTITIRGQAESWATDPSSFVAGLETFGTTVTGTVSLEIARVWTP